LITSSASVVLIYVISCDICKIVSALV
jgi:hypothetical protein